MSSEKFHVGDVVEVLSNDENALHPHEDRLLKIGELVTVSEVDDWYGNKCIRFERFDGTKSSHILYYSSIKLSSRPSDIKESSPNLNVCTCSMNNLLRFGCNGKNPCRP